MQKEKSLKPGEYLGKKSENTYEKRAIQVDEINDRFVFVESGLSENEEVAVTKVFSLKALSRFDISSEE